MLLSSVQAVAIIVMALVIAMLSLPGHQSPPPHQHERAHEHTQAKERGPPRDLDGRMWGPQLTLLLILIMLLSGGYMTASWLLPPLEELRRATRAFGDGDLEARARIEREDEIGELASSFNDMATRLKQMVIAEREMLASISHELRTPLARIRVAVELLEDGGQELAPSLLEDLGLDLIEVESLLDDIFATARLESVTSSSMTVLSSARDTIDAARLLEEAIRRFRSRHPGREVLLELPEAHHAVAVHVVLMRRALENLLENAHKYSPARDAPIMASLQETSAPGGVELHVRDHGIGIPREERERLFESFYRGASASQTKKPGIGLGLSLAKRIVEAHEGALEIAASGDEPGTLVTLRLPSVDPPTS